MERYDQLGSARMFGTQTSKPVYQIAEFSFVQRCAGNPENTGPDEYVGTPEGLGTHTDRNSAPEISEASGCKQFMEGRGDTSSVALGWNPKGKVSFSDQA